MARMRRTTALGILVAACVSAAALELSGTVADAAGKPVPGADVWLAQDREISKAETDMSGAFSFTEVAVGPAQVVARKEGLALGGVDVAVAGSASISIVLVEPDTATLRLVDPTQFVGQSHRPVAGARIDSLFVNGAFHVPVVDLVPFGFPSHRSDDDGALTIPDLPRGGHVGLTISHRKYADAQLPYLPVGVKRHAEGTGETRPFTIQMVPGLVLRGRVTDEAGQAVPRARVSAFRPAFDGLHKFKESLTDPDGFYWATLPPGRFFVAVRHPGYAAPEPAPVELRLDNEEESVLDVTLPAAHTLRGRVEGPDRRPLGGVSVAYVVGDTIYEQTLTTADGAFCLTVAAGEGRIHVFPPDGLIAADPADVVVQVADEPEIAIQTPILLNELPEITGVVVDPDGAPAPNVLITSLDLDPCRRAITDEAGRFHIALQRVPQQPEVRFLAEHGRRLLRREFDVPLTDPEALGDPDALRVKLKGFRPDLSPCKPENVWNDLAALRDEPAPDIVCDRWFNLPAPAEAGADPPQLTLRDLRGKVLVLTFWAGFDESGPGRDRIEEMNVLHRLFAGVDDVAVIGIHAAATEFEDVNAYIRQYGIEFPVGRDTDESVTFDAYDVNAIPQTVLIDKKGVLRYYDVEGRLLELIKGLRREA
ncbi:MAG: carboxypeptidase regulatory-like domain-containing protein [Candidatus Hydrogenedentes bacterium]|nr:carboxypeptidase regulatory-like domain-containing protein [Candidatus Hydrogenedentota bacterium]